MPAITLDEFCNQWARGKDVRPFHSLLAKNAEDFVTLAGEYALSRFRTSLPKVVLRQRNKMGPVLPSGERNSRIRY